MNELPPPSNTRQMGKQAAEKVRLGGYDSATVYLSLAPLFHVAGLNSSVAVTMAGGTHVFVQPPGGPRGKQRTLGLGWWWVSLADCGIAFFTHTCMFK